MRAPFVELDWLAAGQPKPLVSQTFALEEPACGDAVAEGEEGDRQGCAEDPEMIG